MLLTLVTRLVVGAFGSLGEADQVTPLYWNIFRTDLACSTWQRTRCYGSQAQTPRVVN